MAFAFTSPNGVAALAAYMAGLQQDVVDRLRNGGRNATFALRQSLATDVVEGVGVTGTLYAAEHWRFVGNGRGPGKMPPLKPLEAWAKLKGIAGSDSEARSIAFLIGRKIAKEGSADYRKGNPNLFSEAITAAQPGIDAVLQAFLKDLDNPIAEQFREAFPKAA